MNGSNVGLKAALAIGLTGAAMVITEIAHAAPLAATREGRGHGAETMVLDIEAILNRWQPIAAAAGAGSPAWRELYRTQLSQLPDYWQKQIALVNADAGNPRASYAKFTQTFVNARFNLVREAAAGEKGAAKLGSTTNDQVFIPIIPCRVVDTRASSGGSGPISAGASRAFFFFTTSNAFSWSAQGGASGTAVSACPGTVTTPSGGTLGNIAPSAAMATVTVVNPSAAGNFLIWSGVGAAPTSSALNWAAGQVLANTTVIPAGNRTGGAQDFTVYVNGPSGSAEVVVDVVGYFVENAATALQCATQTVTGNIADNVADGANYAVNVPACPVGYTESGVGCAYSSNSGVFLIEQSVEGGFQDCRWRNVSGVTLSGSNFRAEARCCRVPGQ